ncbi:hypothetical protein Plec18167_008775 [Paecilomyces lecythidis]|uniref:Uncharacterized protein n=1 Tax=Paecilomyces lecythidis TaxID=3004212 RepID=A0ABR3WU80_9EURO
MVNWKSADATERLVGALIAAHPSLKLDYNGMAAMYGRGASYDSIEGQFRKYRRQAEQLKAEASANGVSLPPRGRGSGGTPRTPRGPRGARNGVSKSTPSSGKGKNLDAKVLSTPSRKSGMGNRGQNVIDAINLDDDSDMSMFNINTPVKIKAEKIESASSFTDDYKTESSAVLSSIENVKEDKDKQTESLFDMKQEHVNSQTNGYIDSAAAFSATDAAALDSSFMTGYFTGGNETGYPDMGDLYHDSV